MSERLTYNDLQAVLKWLDLKLDVVRTELAAHDKLTQFYMQRHQTALATLESWKTDVINDMAFWTGDDADDVQQKAGA